MASSFLDIVILNHFIVLTITLFISSLLLVFILHSLNLSWLYSGFVSIFFGLLLSYMAFVYNAIHLNVKLYGLFQPLSPLIIVLIAALLLFNSVQRYFYTYSRIELRLLIFYSMVFLSWYALYLQTITTIGQTSPESFFIVHLYGIIVLLAAEIAGIAIYLVAEVVFFPNFKHSSLIKTIMYFSVGFSFGASLYDTDSDVIIVVERVHQYVFSFPNPIKIYTFISLIIIFVPYILMAYHARRARRILLLAQKTGRGRIDPIAIPRLRLAEISMYTYLLGSGLGLIATWLPAFYPKYALPFGLNITLTIPFIGGLIIILYFTYQTPLWLKERWRAKTQA